MSEENKKTPNAWNNKTLIMAATAVIIAIVIMYFNDQQQQRSYKLQRLEGRIDLLEDWGRPRQNRLQQNGRQGTPPPRQQW